MFMNGWFMALSTGYHPGCVRLGYGKCRLTVLEFVLVHSRFSDGCLTVVTY